MGQSWVKSGLFAVGLFALIDEPLAEVQSTTFGTRGSVDVILFPEPQSLTGFQQQQIHIKPIKANTERIRPEPISLEAWAGKPEKQFQPVKTDFKQSKNTSYFIGGVRKGVQVIKPKQKVAFDTLITKPFVTLPSDQRNIPIIDQQVETVDLNPANKRRNVNQFQITPALEVAALPPENTPNTIGQLDLKHVTINASILFSANSANLQPATIRDLEKIASLLRADPTKRLELQSFASGENSRRLALTRALRVRKQLMDSGINSNRLILKAKTVSNTSDQPDRLNLIEIN